MNYHVLYTYLDGRGKEHRSFFKTGSLEQWGNPEPGMNIFVEGKDANVIAVYKEDINNNPHMDLLKSKCGKAYEICKKNPTNDRLLFKNSYELIVEAIHEDMNMKSPLLRVATGKTIYSEIMELVKFVDSLKDRGMI